MNQAFRRPSDEVYKAWALHQSLENMLHDLWDLYGDDFVTIIQIDSNYLEHPGPPGIEDDIPW